MSPSNRHPWSPLWCDSRTGASHRRRQVPCQDACGLELFELRDGEPVAVLAVSDGHGGSRYTRSAVGSRLACTIALEAVKQEFQLAAGRSRDAEHWRRWLAVELPATIVGDWRRQVGQHWQAEPPVPEQPFSTVPYGATLGLLVLSRHWWGYTGLGDWDLVRVDGEGQAELLSSEPDTAGGGEATFSLCMDKAEQHFAGRSGLQELTEEDPEFSLLISTDGVRKSCSTDADYLTLARYLVQLPPGQPSGEPPQELAEGLDRISSQGSGDDVSVAMAHWGPQPSARRPGRSATISRRVVQPALAESEAISGRPPTATLGLPNTEDGSGDDLVQSRLPTGRAGRRSRPAARRHRMVRVRWLVVVGGLAAVGFGVLWWRALGPFARQEVGPPQLTAAQKGVLKQQVQELCRLPDATTTSRPSDQLRERQAPGANGTQGLHQDLRSTGQPPGASRAGRHPSGGVPATTLQERIRATLNQRRETFTTVVRGGREVRNLLLATAPSSGNPFRRDPLTALIAWSWRDPATPATQDPLEALQACPELKRELPEQWRRSSRDAAAQRERQPAPVTKRASDRSSSKADLTHSEPASRATPTAPNSGLKGQAVDLQTPRTGNTKQPQTSSPAKP